MKRGRKGILTLIKIVDHVKVCKKGNDRRGLYRIPPEQ